MILVIALSILACVCVRVCVCACLRVYECVCVLKYSIQSVCVCEDEYILSFDVLDIAVLKVEINVEHAANPSKKAEFRYKLELMSVQRGEGRRGGGGGKLSRGKTRGDVRPRRARAPSFPSRGNFPSPPALPPSPRCTLINSNFYLNSAFFEGFAA